MIKHENAVVLTDYSRLEIDEDSSGDVLAGSSLGEEGVERVVAASDGLVTGHLAVRLDPVLQAVQLPAGISHLDSGLADMDRDTFAHIDRFLVVTSRETRKTSWW